MSHDDLLGMLDLRRHLPLKAPMGSNATPAVLVSSGSENLSRYVHGLMQ